MALAVYNTLTRRKERFESLEPGHVRMYVCGPTVYDEPHLGHARSAIAFDVIRRTFEAFGNRVTYVKNITDVDDKVIARATEEGRSPFEIAEHYTRAYDAAMESLGVSPPTIAPRATAHIMEMLALCETLIARGFAYESGGDVYFAVEKFQDYGKLSNRTLDEMRAGERVEPDARKRHPMDFALWKSAKPGEPSWPSPWGDGRPGWHLECSAMSSKYLGETFDIHGGGLDLIFPHHENEVAQSECATGLPFARYWLHNGFVTVNREKMSKSLKNFTTVAQLLAAWPAPVLRYLLVVPHYRSPIDFSQDALEDAAGASRRLATFSRNLARALGETAEGRSGDPRPESDLARDVRGRFVEAMEDDFNTPAAIAVLFEMVSEGNAAIERGAEPEELRALAAAFGDLTGMLGLRPERGPAAPGRIAPLVEILLRLREEARAAKDWTRADEIRSALGDAGVVVEDRPGGARWHVEA